MLISCTLHYYPIPFIALNVAFTRPSVLPALIRRLGLLLPLILPSLLPPHSHSHSPSQFVSLLLILFGIFISFLYGHRQAHFLGALPVNCKWLPEIIVRTFGIIIPPIEYDLDAQLPCYTSTDSRNMSELYIRSQNLTGKLYNVAIGRIA